MSFKEVKIQMEKKQLQFGTQPINFKVREDFELLLVFRPRQIFWWFVPFKIFSPQIVHFWSSDSERVKHFYLCFLNSSNVLKLLPHFNFFGHLYFLSPWQVWSFQIALFFLRFSPQKLQFFSWSPILFHKWFKYKKISSIVVLSNWFFKKLFLFFICA